MLRQTLWIMLFSVAACDSDDAASPAPQEPDSLAPTQTVRTPDEADRYIPVAKPEGPYVFYGQSGNWGGVFIEEGVANDGDLTIGDRIYLDSPSSAGWYSSQIETKAIPPGGAVYETGAFTINVEDGGCDNDELKAAFPDRLIVEWDGGRNMACGGWRKATTSIENTTWMVTRVGELSEPMTNPPAATLTFRGDGGFGGTIDCNDGGLEATWSDETFNIISSDIMQTELGCEDGPNDAFAKAFWSRMPDATGWSRDGDVLTIKFKDGETASLARLL